VLPSKVTVLSAVHSTRKGSETAQTKSDLVFLGRQSSFNLLQLSYQRQALGIESIILWNPQKAELEDHLLEHNDTIMKRYSLINRTKTAKTIGIIVVNSKMKRFAKVLTALRNLLNKHQKKYYIFTMSIHQLKKTN